MKDERRMCLYHNDWAVYLRGSKDEREWQFLGTANYEDPSTAARVAVSEHRTSGVWLALTVGTAGAFEYRISIDSSGPLYEAK